MNPLRLLLFISALGAVIGCTSTHLPLPPYPDIMDVTLSAPSEQVKGALIHILRAGGYDVDEDNSASITSGPRREIGGPWDWLLRWRFGVIKSRVEATVTPLEENTTRLRLQVFPRSKDGILDTWEDAESPLPQNAANQVRLLKNALQIL